MNIYILIYTLISIDLDWLADSSFYTKISLTLFLPAGTTFAFNVMFEISGLTEEAGLLAKETAAAKQQSCWNNLSTQ